MTVRRGEISRPAHRRPRAWTAVVVAALAVVALSPIGLQRWDAVWAAMPGRVGTPAVFAPVEPHPPDDPPLLRLAAVGDVGTGDAVERATGELVARVGGSDPFDALVLLGDNVYPNGEPARVGATVLEPFARVLGGGAALLPVLGNHDVRDGNAAGQMEALGMPGRWYSVDLGPVLFVGLDSTRVDDAHQTAWLERTLAGAEDRRVVVAMHHPAFSAGFHGSEPAVQDVWVPLFGAYEVDLVLSGHDHDYQRSVTIDGVTYVVSGGGARLRPTGAAEFTAFSASVLHFVEIAVWDDRLELRAVGHDGVFDSVRLLAGGR